MQENPTALLEREPAQNRSVVDDWRQQAQGEYLIFSVGREEFGIGIASVQEIRCYDKPTSIPNAPPYVKGVINLRGLILPVVDMRQKLGQGETEINAFTVVIVVRVDSHLWGIVVDAVNDVLLFEADALRPVPHFEPGMDISYMKCMGNLDGRIVMLIDIERFLSGEALPT